MRVSLILEGLWVKMESNTPEAIQARKRSRRWKMAQWAFWAGNIFSLLAFVLYYFVPQHFGAFGMAVTVTIGGCYGIANIFMHQESKNKRAQSDT